MIIQSDYKNQIDNQILREDLYQGKILLFSPNKESKKLSQKIVQTVSYVFPNEDIQFSEFYHTPNEHYTRLFKAKKRFSYDTKVYVLLKELIYSFGFVPKDNWFDLPRLRGITTNGHHLKQARMVYSIHRDTWYSNPQAQINWWIPAFDIELNSSFGFYPSYWNKPIQNLSHEFDYSDWKAEGGFQTLAKPLEKKIYPSISEPLNYNDEVRFECEAGSVLLFSSAHLHGTLANQTKKTRFSTDFRTLHLEDHSAGKGAPNLDNLSKGSIMEDYLNCEDFRKYTKI